MRREHESLTVEWANASRRFYGSLVALETLQAAAGIGLTIWLVFDHSASNGISSREGSTLLLLIYWALSLPILGEEIAWMVRQYPSLRNITLRLLEPLNAPEDNGGTENNTFAMNQQNRGADLEPRESEQADVGVRIEMANVTVRASGHEILDGINLTIGPGEHVAVVGASGAGKSTLVGLLLGWHQISGGTFCIDGKPATQQQIMALRMATAWVDPAIQIWNRSLLYNLQYGSGSESVGVAGEAIRVAELYSVLEVLPDGLQSVVGEGGGLVSGGEGQRVRFGRAVVGSRGRKGARLVILDEPFRGLDRETRRLLLARSRQLWPNATLLCVTHDVAETCSFDRVLVVDGGHIVEQGVPSELIAMPNSRYGALLVAEDQAQSELWSDPRWRRMVMAGGQLAEDDASSREAA